MDVSPILTPLNDAQRAAVTAPLVPVLVLAGAGSGKTRVLTHRIAWLIQAEGVSPHGILAVTFTNKAAAEMRSRIEALLGMPGGALWLGTFHGLAHRLLRLHWREAGLPQSFQILDSEDQQRLIKKLLKALGAGRGRAGCRARCSSSSTSTRTRAGGRSSLKDGGDPTEQQLIRLYGEYEQACARAGVGGFRRAAAARLRAVARQPGAAAALPPRASGTCWWTSSRTPTPSSTPGCGCWRAPSGMPVRGRRRRPVDLPLARRARGEPAAVPQRLPAGAAVQAGAELPLHRHDPRRRQRADRPQHRPPRQEPVDQRRARRAGARSTAAYNERDEAEFVVARIQRLDRRTAARAASARSCTAPTRSRACSRRR